VNCLVIEREITFFTVGKVNIKRRKGNSIGCLVMIVAEIMKFQLTANSMPLVTN
jgi:hypothetical protein